MSEEKAKKKIIRISQIQTVQLGGWLKNKKQEIETNKWIVPVVHDLAQKELGFPIGRETVRDLGRAVGITFHSVQRNVNTEPANESNKIRRELETLREKYLNLDRILGNEMVKGTHQDEKILQLQREVQSVWIAFQSMANRIAKLEDPK